MMRVLFGLSLLGLFACTSSQNDDAHSLGIAMQEAEYQVVFPSAQVQKKLEKRTEDSLGPLSVEILSTANAEQACWVSINTYSINQMEIHKKDSVAFLEGLQDAVLKGLALDLEAEQRDTLGVQLDFQAIGIDKRAEFRILWKDNKVYQLGWLEPLQHSEKDSIREILKERFFNEFALNEATAQAPAADTAKAKN